MCKIVRNERYLASVNNFDFDADIIAPLTNDIFHNKCG